MAKPACTKILDDLSQARVIELLTDERVLLCHVPPLKPIPGEVYVYSRCKIEESGKLMHNV